MIIEEMQKIDLFILDNTGDIRIWSISYTGNVITITHGKYYGEQQTKTENVYKGLAGRSLEEQVISRVQSRINKQLDRGYKNTIEGAEGGSTNQLGLSRPMLAHKKKDVKVINFPCYVQFKYNGHRCLITNQYGNIIAYSRGGKMIKSIDHILDELIIDEGDTIDGELYCHGQSLQTISSWIKRKQEDSKRIRYHAYDIISKEPYWIRLGMLKDIFTRNKNSEFVPTNEIENEYQIAEHFKHARLEGYEGLILRHGSTGYEINKRSKSLVKVKEKFDDEFEVIDIIPSKDEWARLVTKDFKVACHGTMEYKKFVLDNKKQFIGKKVKVEYYDTTDDGVPFHPVALEFRDAD